MKPDFPSPEASLGDWRRALMSALKEFPSPAAEADGLMAGLLGVNRTGLHARLNEPAGLKRAGIFLQALQRRQNHEPLQYITGRCDFWGLNLAVQPGCLVPRPETEFLVEAVLEHFQGGIFLDWGTGTGCIALALLSSRPASRAIMAEANPKSLVCAWKNLYDHDLIDRTLLWHSREPDDIPGGMVDLIISNPPYIPSEQVPHLMAEVSRWEPRMALDGGPDGLSPYGPLMDLARRRLRPGGLLAVEFGGAEQVLSLRSMAQGFIELVCGCDLSGIPRYFVWQNPPA